MIRLRLTHRQVDALAMAGLFEEELQGDLSDSERSVRQAVCGRNMLVHERDVEKVSAALIELSNDFDSLAENARDAEERKWYVSDRGCVDRIQAKLRQLSS